MREFREAILEGISMENAKIHENPWKFLLHFNRKCHLEFAHILHVKFLTVHQYYTKTHVLLRCVTVAVLTSTFSVLTRTVIQHGILVTSTLSRSICLEIWRSVQLNYVLLRTITFRSMPICAVKHLPICRFVQLNKVRRLYVHRGSMFVCHRRWGWVHSLHLGATGGGSTPITRR